MKIVDAAQLAEIPHGDFVEALREGFKTAVTTPHRAVYETGPTTTLLLMPAWNQAFTGIKTITAKSDNAALGLSTIQGSYLLIDNATGAPVAVIDGTELTRRRTAAASALAADYLARKDSSTLLLVGAGALAPHFAAAHKAVRNISRVMVYNRNVEKARAVASELGGEAVTDLERAMAQADIISGITSATEAIVLGAWVRPGTHIDLAGAFKPNMRETDGAAIGMARVYVDTREGVAIEAGDLIQAEAEGHFKFADIQGDLAQLCKGTMLGRKTDAEVTLFKSCGTALEDLAAAAMVYLQRT
jgi:ornithine cyclodeaminase/alanine dehydrogenase-like protein (mu-crystallin family)